MRDTPIIRSTIIGDTRLIAGMNIAVMLNCDDWDVSSIAMRIINAAIDMDVCMAINVPVTRTFRLQNVSSIMCACAINERNLFSLDLCCNFFYFSFKFQSFLPILLFTIIWSFGFTGLSKSFGAKIFALSNRLVSFSSLFYNSWNVIYVRYLRSETKKMITILSRYHPSECMTKSILAILYHIVSMHAEWVKHGYPFVHLVTCFRRDNFSVLYKLYHMVYSTIYLAHPEIYSSMIKRIRCFLGKRYLCKTWSTW